MVRASSESIQYRRQGPPWAYLKVRQPASRHPVGEGRLNHHHAAPELVEFQLRATVNQASERVQKKKLAVALANKLARINWRFSDMNEATTVTS